MNDLSMLALSPLDGRYSTQTETLRAFFSEYALFKYRLHIEIEWLITLSQHLPIPKMTDDVQKYLRNLYTHFDATAYQRIKSLEKSCNHDVKAVEYYLKEKLTEQTSLSSYTEWVHFSCTSEDINNLAYGLMLKNTLQQVAIPSLQKLLDTLTQFAHQEANTAMLARTHGQAATPTTMGKEFANFVYRLKQQLTGLTNLPLLGKFNGAVGNYNAHLLSMPDIDWLQLNQQFVESLGLTWNPYTTQIEPHDYVAAILSQCALIHNALIDLCRDCWGYISLGYLKQKITEQEVGSSTMPHKVNPIDFEIAEGNLSLAQALAQFLATRLPISRWQRDLVDSTLMRNLGCVFGYALVAYQSLLKGLNKIEADHTVLQQDLEQHYEVLAEAIQTVMRHHQLPMPYEQLKALTRGQIVTQENLYQFIATLALPEAAKQKLLELTPQQYIGYAAALAKKI